MSFSKRSLLKASRSCSRVSLRTEATTSAAVDSAGPSNETSSKPAKPSKPSPKSRSPLPQLKVGLVLSRNPLLQKTPHPLEKAYHDHSFKLRHALSNPVPEDFYFRPGSLPERRFQQAQHDFVVATYGARIAGKAPAVGDIPPERPLDEVDRLKWVKEDEARGEQSLERLPEQELFCLTQDKNSGKWGLPTVLASGKAPLHEVIESELTGVGGAFDGTGMDTWLVTKKPIGYINENGQRTFFLRSHILAGEPKLSSGAIWKSWAWLTKEEVHTRLTAQGDKELWKGTRNMFGVSSTTETPLKVELLSEEDDILD